MWYIYVVLDFTACPGSHRRRAADRQETGSPMTPTIELAPDKETRLPQNATVLGDEQSVSDEAHALLVQSLQKAGLLTTLPTQPGRATPFQPITVQGRSVSETLLEDRR